jgi:hypothetical protein
MDLNPKTKFPKYDKARRAEASLLKQKEELQNRILELQKLERGTSPTDTAIEANKKRAEMLRKVLAGNPSPETEESVSAQLELLGKQLERLYKEKDTRTTRPALLKAEDSLQKVDFRLGKVREEMRKHLPSGQMGDKARVALAQVTRDLQRLQTDVVRRGVSPESAARVSQLKEQAAKLRGQALSTEPEDRLNRALNDVIDRYVLSRPKVSRVVDGKVLTRRTGLPRKGEAPEFELTGEPTKRELAAMKPEEDPDADTRSRVQGRVAREAAASGMFDEATSAKIAKADMDKRGLKDDGSQPSLFKETALQRKNIQAHEASVARKAQEAITNQEGTYAELDAMLNSLDDMIEDQVWA